MSVELGGREPCRASLRGSAGRRERAGTGPRSTRDWEALEDAFENNAPEVHSYLHLTTGEVLRVVDGVADPQMHVRIASDGNYLRIDPVSSREQYRWMERFIPMAEDPDLREKLTQAIDGKGAFRRFKDVLMSFGDEREKLVHVPERAAPHVHGGLAGRARHQGDPAPAWAEGAAASGQRDRRAHGRAGADDAPKSQSGRRSRNAETLRQHLKELAELLGPRDLDTIVSFGEFLEGAARRPGVRAPPRAHAAGARAGASTPPPGEDEAPS